MRINYNVTGAKRKELAQVIAGITGARAEYQYMPTCAYVIDFFTLSKDGVLEFDDRSDTEIVENVLEGIAAAGFECEAQEEPEPEEVSEPEAAEATEYSEPEKAETAEASEPETVDAVDEKVSEDAVEDDATEAEANEIAENAEAADQKDTDETMEQPTESEDSAQEDTSEEPETAETGIASSSTWLTISLPLDKVDAGKLTRILEAKGKLIKKALGVDSLPIEIGEAAISFPWFQELPDADTSTAYTHFISALCKMSREQKRVTATEKEVDNEKYAFRCFLLRLGFIGEEYKTDRKILLKNLTGSSAFKSGARKEAAADEA
ncbi:MAG: virulence protein [Clostridiales bacterium]|nr:virulence protein [Clostridiales bacterium]